MFTVKKFVVSLCVYLTNTCINTDANFLQTIFRCFQDKNIVKSIACIHYTENREDNNEILLWFGTLKSQISLMVVITTVKYS
jgi:hypothetical protein